MTDHEYAATGPGPGSGPRPAPGTGPSGAASAAAEATAPGAASGAPPAPAGEDFPPFRRDRRHKMIAGVCAGLGRHTDLDPVIFRITLAVLAATGGIGLLFYGFAWLFVPYEDDEENEVRKLLTGRVDGQALAAVLFALVGCGVLLTMIRNGGVLAFAVVLSVLLAGAGYWSRRRGAPDPDPLSAQAVADAPPEAQAPPIPVSYPSWWRDPIVKDGTHVGGTGYLWGPADVRGPDTPGIDFRLGTPWVHGQDVSARRGATPGPRGPRGPHWIGGWIFLFALLAGALGTGLTWDTHPLGTSLQTGLAAALTVFGVGTAVSSFLGRTGAGSLFLALVTAALLAAATAMPSDITTHWTRVSWTPATAAQVASDYDLGTGVGTLDLRHIRVADGRTVSTSAQVSAGQLKIVVPADVTVRMRIDVRVGDIQLPGDDKKDVDVEPGRHKDVTLPPTSGAKHTGTLDLDLRVGAGQVEVTRAAA